MTPPGWGSVSTSFRLAGEIPRRQGKIGDAMGKASTRHGGGCAYSFVSGAFSASLRAEIFEGS